MDTKTVSEAMLALLLVGTLVLTQNSAPTTASLVPSTNVSVASWAIQEAIGHYSKSNRHASLANAEENYGQVTTHQYSALAKEKLDITHEALGTVYIRANGSVEGTSNIQRDGDVYTFTDNIRDEIVVERSDIIIDGNGYSLEGDGQFYGLYVFEINNVTIRDTSINGFYTGILINSNHSCVTDNIIANNDIGIEVAYSTNSCVSGNTVIDNRIFGMELAKASEYNSVLRNTLKNNTRCGIRLQDSNHNEICGNNVEENGIGFCIYDSSNNIVQENRIANNNEGIRFYDSSNNLVYHNRFMNNAVQASTHNSTNLWDDGYPSGGNYWSDYVDEDMFSGTFQNETCSDSIWDHPYTIGEKNIDRYPLAPSVDVDPDTLNFKSKGKWITVHIELPKGFDLGGIDRTAILLNGTIRVDSFWVNKPLQSVIGDYDEDGIQDLMVKFDRQSVLDFLRTRGIANAEITLAVTGAVDGIPFECNDKLVVIG